MAAREHELNTKLHSAFTALMTYFVRRLPGVGVIMLASVGDGLMLQRQNQEILKLKRRVTQSLSHPPILVAHHTLTEVVQHRDAPIL
jgi:hypothetical protein